MKLPCIVKSEYGQNGGPRVYMYSVCSGGVDEDGEPKVNLYGINDTHPFSESVPISVIEAVSPHMIDREYYYPRLKSIGDESKVG